MKQATEAESNPTASGDNVEAAGFSVGLGECVVVIAAVVVVVVVFSGELQGTFSVQLLPPCQMFHCGQSTS